MFVSLTACLRPESFDTHT